MVNWYASHPAEPINGAVVSNLYVHASLGPNGAADSAFFPRDLAPVMEQLRIHPAKLTPNQMLPFFLEKLPSDDDPRLRRLAGMMAQAATTHNAATYLAEAEDWDFLAVYYDMIDHVGHDFAEYAPPRMEHISEEDFKTYCHVVESTYRYHDMMLGRWLEIVGEETTVIILSDHGFYLGEARPLAERGRLSGERPKGVHRNPLVWHRTHGLLAMKGPNIKSDSLVHGASLLDITPTILAALDVPVPEDCEGQVLTQIFKTRPKVETVSTYEAPHPDDGMHRGLPTEDQDPWAAQQALKQLADLGYIDVAPENAAKQMALACEARDSHLAQIYFGTGRHEEAMELLRELAKNSSDLSYLCRQAMCLISLQRLDEAESIIRQVIEKAPHYGLAHMLLAQVSLLQGKTEEAEKLFRTLRETETEMPALHNQVAGICLRQGKWEEAASLFSERARGGSAFGRGTRWSRRCPAQSREIGRRHLRTHAGGFTSARPRAKPR